MGRALRKSAKAWLMHHGTSGMFASLHTSDDYPRELEARGMLVRKGRGMLGHAHELELTREGADEVERLLTSRLLCRAFEVPCG